MAERRMFARTVVDSDAFLDMPLSAQALYFHFGMRTDDDGFVDAPKKIQKMVSASDDDAKLLIAKGFVIPFESGVIVIRHWGMHNKIKPDRYKPTAYQAEKALLHVRPDKTYSLQAPTETQVLQSGTEMVPKWNQSGTEMEHRLGKDRLGKDSIEGVQGEPAPKRKRFTPPTLDELQAYIHDQGYNVDAQRFLDHYVAVGWKVGKNPMKDWRAAVRTWNNREKPKQEKHQPDPRFANEPADVFSLYK